MKAVYGLPIICLTAASRIFRAKQVSDRGQSTFVTVLLDAQALLCLVNGRVSDLDLLTAGVQIVVRAADLQEYVVVRRRR